MGMVQVLVGKLLLDPNNYRLRGENSIHIKELLESFKGNGYLKIDNVIVRQIEEENAYLVVEGNRRVATLKDLE